MIQSTTIPTESSRAGRDRGLVLQGTVPTFMRRMLEVEWLQPRASLVCTDRGSRPRLILQLQRNPNEGNGDTSWEVYLTGSVMVSYNEARLSFS